MKPDEANFESVLVRNGEFWRAKLDGASSGWRCSQIPIRSVT